MFSRNGRFGASTREIAAEAGTTERTLFKHFGSKEGLLRAVLDEAVLAQLAPASLADLKRAIEAFNEDFQAWHHALVLARLEALRRTPELTRLLIIELVGDESQRAQFVSQWQEAAWKPLAALFEQLQLVGELRSDVPRDALVAQFLRSNIAFLISRLLMAPTSKERDQQDVAALVTLFFTGVAAKTRPNQRKDSARKKEQHNVR